MTGPKGGDAALIAALACGGTVEAAAKQAGVSERTAYRRLEDEGFRRRVDDARAEIVKRAVARLSAASVQAADTLRQLLSSDMDFCRLAAARSILELGAKLREQTELAARLAALEAQLGERQTPTRGGRSWGV
jgi:hypothetical protein